jgi:hypothetical protein
MHAERSGHQRIQPPVDLKAQRQLTVMHRQLSSRS